MQPSPQSSPWPGRGRCAGAGEGGNMRWYASVQRCPGWAGDSAKYGQYRSALSRNWIDSAPCKAAWLCAWRSAIAPGRARLLAGSTGTIVGNVRGATARATRRDALFLSDHEEPTCLLQGQVSRKWFPGLWSRNEGITRTPARCECWSLHHDSDAADPQPKPRHRGCRYIVWSRATAAGILKNTSFLCGSRHCWQKPRPNVRFSLQQEGIQKTTLSRWINANDKGSNKPTERILWEY